MQFYRLESLRKLLLFLQRQPEILDVILEEEKYMHIKFDDGFVEHWFYGDQKIPKFSGRWYRLPDDVMYPFNDEYPDFRCQFSRSHGDSEYEKKGKFFLYTPSYLNEFMFVNIRIWMHRLAKNLEKEGYVEPWLPQEEIDKIICELNNKNWFKHKIDKKLYKINPSIAKLSRPFIVMQNLCMEKYWKTNGIFVTLDLLYRKKWPITRNNIIWYMRKRRQARFETGHPIGLATILKEHYSGIPVIDHTDYDWVKTAALICNVPCLKNGDGVHISNRIPSGYKKEITLNNGDIRVIGPRPDNKDFIDLSISK